MLPVSTYVTSHVLPQYSWTYCRNNDNDDDDYIDADGTFEMDKRRKRLQYEKMRKLHQI